MSGFHCELRGSAQHPRLTNDRLSLFAEREGLAFFKEHCEESQAAEAEVELTRSLRSSLHNARTGQIGEASRICPIKAALTGHL